MNNIVLAVLQGVVVMAVAPFFSGLGRVIRAKMHNRRGPSIMQDYRDLAKLFARPESQSEDASFALRIMPPLFFAVAFMLAMGLPLFTAQSPIPVFGDAITIMYSLALARFFFALCGVDSSNAYAGIGGVRELLMSVLIEPSMLLALFAAAWCAAPPTSHHGSAHHDGRHRRAGRRDPRRHRLCDCLLHGTRQAAV